ncbi:MAG: regulatory signaling modulator protein AmpE [Porticoccaceae bacterium]|nr:regulatory signaling modulator protein AmpE [Porticoccaceae bacterium]MDG1311390.1 regulatory signaling modulator protein AmpE [Porticoccaceae bacterium]
MNFLIALIAIILLEAYSELGFVQRDGWLRKWHKALSVLDTSGRSSLMALALLIGAPVLVLHLVFSALAQQNMGLISFLLELLILLYALGRGNLDTQIVLFTSDLQRDDLQAALHDAAVFNTAYREGRAETAEDLKAEVFTALPYRIFERSFVVIFWFFFFGAPAALAYRLMALHGDLGLDSKDCQAVKWLWLMEWLPVRLLGLTVGLVGNFSKAAGSTRQLIFSRRIGTGDFLRQAIKGALGESDSSVPLNPLTINAVVSLFGRAMTAWLVIIAILVILS